MRSSLRAQLAALRPTELILPSQGISSVTKKVLTATLRSPRINRLPVDSSFWSANKTLQELGAADYFKGMHLPHHVLLLEIQAIADCKEQNVTR